MLPDKVRDVFVRLFGDGSFFCDHRIFFYSPSLVICVCFFFKDLSGAVSDGGSHQDPDDQAHQGSDERAAPG